jgi:hypothetical protein
MLAVICPSASLAIIADNCTQALAIIADNCTQAWHMTAATSAAVARAKARNIACSS